MGQIKNTKLLLLILLLVAGVATVTRFWNVLMLFLVSLIIAYLLTPMADWIARKTRMKRGFAVALVLLLFIALIVVCISLAVPAIANQVSSLLRELRRYAGNFDELITKAQQYLESIHLPKEVVNTIYSLLSQSDKYIATFLTGIVSSLVGFSLKLFDGVVVVILSVYFMLDGKKMLDAFLNTLPDGPRNRAAAIAQQADKLTWLYVKSKVFISLGMSVVTYIGLSLIGLDYALVFALMTFVLDFIPYFGSILAGVIEGFFALITGGVGFAVGVLVFVLVIQQIEGNVVVPKVQGDLTGIHPITVMFAILACNEIWGPVGMLIAVPIAAILKIIVKEIYLYIVSFDASVAAKALPGSAAPDDEKGNPSV